MKCSCPKKLLAFSFLKISFIHVVWKYCKQEIFACRKIFTRFMKFFCCKIVQLYSTPVLKKVSQTSWPPFLCREYFAFYSTSTSIQHVNCFAIWLSPFPLLEPAMALLGCSIILLLLVETVSWWAARTTRLHHDPEHQTDGRIKLMGGPN